MLAIWKRAQIVGATAMLLAAACGADGGSDSEVSPAGPAAEDAPVPHPDAAQGSEPTTESTPYAHVVGVSVAGEAGDYEFSVSVESADIDCTQYADWWEVLSEGGALLYRRVLEHSHTDENGTTDADAPGNTFTRSGGPVAIGASEVVVVRAHISVGGYNGRAMRGSAATGFVDASDLDTGFAADVEDAEPQPSGCLF